MLLFQMAEVLEWERLLLQSREVSALQGVGVGGRGSQLQPLEER